VTRCLQTYAMLQVRARQCLQTCAMLPVFVQPYLLMLSCLLTSLPAQRYQRGIGARVGKIWHFFWGAGMSASSAAVTGALINRLSASLPRPCSNLHPRHSQLNPNSKHRFAMPRLRVHWHICCRVRPWLGCAADPRSVPAKSRTRSSLPQGCLPASHECPYIS